MGMTDEQQGPDSDELRRWVTAIAQHTQPDHVRWCDGSDDERHQLEQAMLADGSLIALDPTLHPGSFLHRSDPRDVARTEHLTFISTSTPDEVGPTNNWMSREDARRRVWPLFASAMKGRTMYVVPYLMGPPGSPMSRIGVQITDSPYVVLSLRIMTRMGRAALRARSTGEAVRGVHSMGDLSPDRRFVVHFPDTCEIWSVGSGYGGNALLSKKCHALRLASVQARREGWLAEHMLILGLTSPAGRTHYVAAAFPSACGKTNLAMLVPTLPGWKVETIGDDICWMHPGPDGRLWAINPEHGMFGVAPGTSEKTNPNAMAALTHDVLFTNVALRSNGRVWWEGLSRLEPGEVLVDWRGDPWTANERAPAAHPNSRFTTPLANCPSVQTGHREPNGVPISAIVFGGRRSKVTPLVYEARSWAHGVYMGATLTSETTAAATGAVGVLRNDPMAMLPFCGYHLGDYLAHWLAVGGALARPPKIFHVNWFRTGADGRFLWPGFGDNVRVLKWIVGRLEETLAGQASAIGQIPAPGELDVTGLDLAPAALEALTAIDPGEWLADAAHARAFLARLGERLPGALATELEALAARLRDQQAVQP